MNVFLIVGVYTSSRSSLHGDVERLCLAGRELSFGFCAETACAALRRHGALAIVCEVAIIMLTGF
jgi:hypothetical protein